MWNEACLYIRYLLALFLLTSLMAKRKKKIASVTVYYPVHTRGCENFRVALKKQMTKMEINNGWCNSSFVFMYLKNHSSFTIHVRK